MRGGDAALRTVISCRASSAARARRQPCLCPESTNGAFNLDAVTECPSLAVVPFGAHLSAGFLVWIAGRVAALWAGDPARRGFRALFAIVFRWPTVFGGGECRPCRADRPSRTISRACRAGQTGRDAPGPSGVCVYVCVCTCVCACGCVITFEGIPRGDGVRELLFSLPRFLTKVGLCDERN